MRFITIIAVLLLASCDAFVGAPRNSRNERYVGRNYTEPDVELTSAVWVYRDSSSGQIVPLLSNQSPVEGAQLGLSIQFRVVSGNDARSIDWTVVDEHGNTVHPETRYTFQRNQEKGLNRRDRGNRPYETIVLWHRASGQKRYFVHITAVNGFRPWNPANGSREVSYRVVTPNHNPQVITH